MKKKAFITITVTNNRKNLPPLIKNENGKKTMDRPNPSIVQLIKS